MGRRRLTFFLFAAVLAFLTAMLVHSALKSMRTRIAALEQNIVRIVAAARPLAPGEVISAADVKLVSWPREHEPPGALSDLQAAMGKVVITPLGVNQPVLASALLESHKAGGVLPLLIPKGMRAISIAVDEVSDMAGFVLPHSRVDVLVSIGGSGGPGGSGTDFTRIVLQNIEVLAVAQRLAGAPDKPHAAKVVTLLVTPEGAERLAAASRLGTLALAMRNYSDQEHLLTAGVSSASLLGIFRPPQQPAESPDRRSIKHRASGRAVEVIRNGTEHQTVDFVANGHLRRPPPKTPVAQPPGVPPNR